MFLRLTGSFTSDSLAVVAHDQSVYTVEPGKIQVRNFQVLRALQTNVGSTG